MTIDRSKSDWLLSAVPGDKLVLKCACDRPQFLQTSKYRGCSICRGTGTRDEPMAYIEGGRAYPFFTLEINMTEDGPRYLGWVAMPEGGVAQPLRTRPLGGAGLAMTPTPVNGSVTPRSEPWNLPAPAHWTHPAPPARDHGKHIANRIARDRQYIADNKHLDHRSRDPPEAVKRTLKSEVGHACPIAECGSPFLTWHHFDPPWEPLHQHVPEGMIALCKSHHDQADSGIISVAQLRRLKSAPGRIRPTRLEWLHHRTLARLGNLVVIEPEVVLALQGVPIVWFARQDDGYARLNVQMPTTSDECRLLIEDHVWVATGPIAGLECPPSGKRIYAQYANGDEIDLQFTPCATVDDAAGAMPTGLDMRSLLPFFSVSIDLRLPAAGLSLCSTETQLGGILLASGVVRNCPVAASGNPIGVPRLSCAGRKTLHDLGYANMSSVAITF